MTTLSLRPREFLLAALSILGVLTFWYWDLFTFQWSYLGDDHLVQHFPWMHALSTELKAGRFPLWSNLIGCGFPLFAEGQIAALYPPNLLIYTFLPFKFAYNFSVIFHYWLGGLIFYIFCRQFGLTWKGAGLATFLYLFGSAQGGYFYNMNSQKTVIWFPLALLGIETLVRSRKIHIAVWLGILFGVQVLAGYLQIAFYSILFSMVFFFLRSVVLQKKDNVGTRLRRFFWQASLMGFFAILVSLPQLLATFELSQFSSRPNVPEDFAYIGSFHPLGFLTLLFPFLDGFLRADFFIGVFSLFLLALAWLGRKSWSLAHRSIFWVMVLALLIALGQFSPLYVGIVKLTGFYGFRVPSKVLYFLVVGLCLFAGFGWDRLVQGGNEKKERRAIRVFQVILGLGLIVGLSGAFIIRLIEPLLSTLGKWILMTRYVGNPLHPHSAEVYMDKLASFLSTLESSFSLVASQWMQVGVVTLLAFMVLSFLFLKFTSGKKRKVVLTLAIILFTTDVYLYGFTSMRTNWESYDVLTPSREVGQALPDDPELFRLYEYSLSLEKENQFPLIYNLNMFYGLSDVGNYSPLGIKSHRDYFEGLGASNNSLSVNLADPDRFQQLRALLNLTNVKYVLGFQRPPGRGFKEVWQKDGFHIFENKEVMPYAFWMNQNQTVSDADFKERIEKGELDIGRHLALEEVAFAAHPPLNKGGKRGWQSVNVLNRDFQNVKVLAQSGSPGWLFMSDLYYPGWVATVDGKSAKIWKANSIFRAIFLEPGTHEVNFVYKPFYQKFFWSPVFALGFGLIFSLFRR